MFKTDYQKFIYKRTFARYLDAENRRENWDETVLRYNNFIRPRVPQQLVKEWENACNAIENLEVMPSMRALWTAGPAAERDNLGFYNCAYIELDSSIALAEMLHVLMNGTGVGFSVERQFINKLPVVPDALDLCERCICVQDSKEGWARAFQELLDHLWGGVIPYWSMHEVRPKGSKLKVFGGRASGPEPLNDLFKFTVKVFRQAQGRKLNSLEVHDIACCIANVVVSGGVRRSACISLSNLSDDRMASAKSGAFWEQYTQRSMANNSVCYTEKPEADRFLIEWLSLIRSKSGERGIFNRESAKFIAQSTGRRDPGYEFGCNPCSEIILRSLEVCNLSEVVVRPDDTLSTLKQKVKYATILGCMQSTFTDFQFVRSDWKKNCDAERLLGVSLTGLRDHPVLGKVSTNSVCMLSAMRRQAIDTARVWSKALGINMPAAITCVKPSGTVSQLVDSASGLHHRYSKFYIRRVRVDTVDPIANMLIDAGVPCSPEVGQTMQNANTLVFDFCMKAPSTAVVRTDETALEQLEYWLMLQTAWCEHKPSITVFVKEHEWVEVGAWVYKNWDYVSGISFLPLDGGLYQLAPYEEITEAEYNAMQAKMPTLDFDDLVRYECDDCTVGSRELACHAGACEL